MSMGTGLAWVWVWVQLELPMGYLCYALTMDGMPKLDPELTGREMIQTWDDLLQQEQQAF